MTKYRFQKFKATINILVINQTLNPTQTAIWIQSTTTKKKYGSEGRKINKPFKSKKVVGDGGVGPGAGGDDGDELEAGDGAAGREMDGELLFKFHSAGGGDRVDGWKWGRRTKPCKNG